MTRLRGADGWAVAGLGIALAIGLPWLLWLGRGMTFFADEWAFIESRSLGDPGTWLRPHNEHWSTIPILIYRAIVETVGLRTYVPYLAVLLALHGLVVVLTFVAVRRAAGPLVALGAAVVLVAYGSGFENLYWGFQIGFVGATAAGLAAMLASDRDDRLGRTMTSVALLVGLATAGVALAFLVVVGVEALLRRRLRAMIVPLSVPVAVYAVWFITFGRPAVATPPLGTEALLSLVESVVTGLANASGAIGGVGPTLGMALVFGIALWTTDRLIRDRSLPPRFVACTYGMVVLYGLIGLTRAHIFVGIIDYTRYTYVAGILLMIGLASLLGPVRVPAAGRPRLVVLAVGGSILAVSLAFNIRLLIEGRRLFLDRAAMTRALVTVGLERPLPASTDPDRTLVLVPSPSSLERIVAAYGSPLSDAIVPGAVEPLPPDVLREAQRRLAEGAEVPR
jgi:hypothetical protein